MGVVWCCSGTWALNRAFSATERERQLQREEPIEIYYLPTILKRLCKCMASDYNLNYFAQLTNSKSLCSCAPSHTEPLLYALYLQCILVRSCEGSAFIYTSEPKTIREIISNSPPTTTVLSMEQRYRKWSPLNGIVFVRADFPKNGRKMALDFTDLQFFELLPVFRSHLPLSL